MDAWLKSKIKDYLDGMAESHNDSRKFFVRKMVEPINKMKPYGKVLFVGCRSAPINADRFESCIFIDLSPSVFRIAKNCIPRDAHLVVADAEFIPFRCKFDTIVLLDSVAYMDDVYGTFKSLRKVSDKNTQIVIASINSSWLLFLHMLESIKLRPWDGPHNWLSDKEVADLLRLSGFELQNIERKAFGMVYCLLARPSDAGVIEDSRPTVSFIIPCYNEEENIGPCIEGVRSVGYPNVEIVVVDDGSTDRTSEVVMSIKDRDVKPISYKPNMGKGVAVRRGFEEATGDVLIILDADMSVPPHEAAMFVEPIAMGIADFVNGTRLLYPMEEGAMSYIRLIGNKLFGIAFSWLLGQRITDTLCGTKALRRSDYIDKLQIKESSWPDFDLLFGAAKNGLRIVELPIHYKRRVAGVSKMKVLKHGLILSKMVLRGVFELKIKPLVGRFKLSTQRNG